MVVFHKQLAIRQQLPLFLLVLLLHPREDSLSIPTHSPSILHVVCAEKNHQRAASTTEYEEQQHIHVKMKNKMNQS